MTKMKRMFKIRGSMLVRMTKKKMRRILMNLVIIMMKMMVMVKM